MASASAIPATQAAVARVSVPEMANASITNASAARSQVVLMWENIASFLDVQGSVPVLRMASVIWRLESAYVLKDGLETIVARLTAQEHLSVPAMEAAVIPIQEGTML